MKIRCVIDGMSLHGMMLSAPERLQLERVLHEQLSATLRAELPGAALAVMNGPSPQHRLRLNIVYAPGGASLGRTLGRTLGEALGATLRNVSQAGPAAGFSTNSLAGAAAAPMSSGGATPTTGSR